MGQLHLVVKFLVLDLVDISALNLTEGKNPLSRLGGIPANAAFQGHHWCSMLTGNVQEVALNRQWDLKGMCGVLCELGCEGTLSTMSMGTSGEWGLSHPPKGAQVVCFLW